MSSPELIRLVRAHYASRGIPAGLVDMICAEAERRLTPAGLEIAPGWRAPLEALHDTFETVDQSQSPAVLSPEPAVILGLSFGYRLESPFSRLPEERRPGPNNTAIARQVGRCHLLFPDAWLAVQYEVGMALVECDTPEPLPELVTPPRDWNLPEVLAYVLDHLPEHAFAKSRTILVVGHAHHFGRTALLLSRAGYTPLAPPKEIVGYEQYDPQEAQPRFRSARDYLWSDFLSLCKLAANARAFSASSGAGASPLSGP